MTQPDPVLEQINRIHAALDRLERTLAQALIALGDLAETAHTHPPEPLGPRTHPLQKEDKP